MYSSCWRQLSSFCFLCFYSCPPDLGGSMCSTCVDVGFVNTMLLMEMRFSLSSFLFERNQRVELSVLIIMRDFERYNGNTSSLKSSWLQAQCVVRIAKYWKGVAMYYLCDKELADLNSACKNRIASNNIPKSKNHICMNLYKYANLKDGQQSKFPIERNSNEMYSRIKMLISFWLILFFLVSSFSARNNRVLHPHK